MSLDQNQVRRVADLARLAVSDEDLPIYVEELNQILKMVDQLQAADTQSITPMAHPLNMHQRLRADAVTETDQRETYFEQAPAARDGHFLVPKVIE